NTFYQQYNLSFQKSLGNNNFSASLTYKNDRYSDKNSDGNSYGLNLKNSTRFNRVLSVDLGAYMNYGRKNNQNYSPFSPGFNFMPYQSLWNADGTPFTSYYADRASVSSVNTLKEYNMLSMDLTPLDEMNRNISKQKDFDARVFAKINLKFTEWLNYSAQYQYELGRYDTRQLKEKESYDVRSFVNTWTCWTPDYTSVKQYVPNGDILKTQNQTTDAWNFRQQLNFQRTFAGKHDVVALVGQELRHQKIYSRSDNLYGYDEAMLSHTTID
ncbi:MAG: SusC/RagA family TonB-linked outer membrane protein, partial [Bacteroidales bacterium]|nr:SusC/RagA family TonB-linked outer membrane protein [Bacteroidales bacterium]